jgi:hypothetical protein
VSDRSRFQDEMQILPRIADAVATAAGHGHGLGHGGGAAGKHSDGPRPARRPRLRRCGLGIAASMTAAIEVAETLRR